MTLSTAAAPPCVDAPFRLDSNGQLVTVPAGSLEEINAQIYNVLSCRKGAKLGDPDFGIPFLPGQLLPLNLTPIVQAIQERVSAAVDVSAVQAAIVATSPQAATVTITAEVLTSSSSVGVASEPTPSGGDVGSLALLSSTSLSSTTELDPGGLT